MAPNDVVQHDLSSGTPFNWSEALLPIEMTDREASVRPGAMKVPVTQRVTAEELTTHPYRSVGRMGVVLADGERRTGSGWVVARRGFITARHCVYLQGWIDTRERKYDMGACV